MDGTGSGGADEGRVNVGTGLVARRGEGLEGSLDGTVKVLLLGRIDPGHMRHCQLVASGPQQAASASTVHHPRLPIYSFVFEVLSIGVDLNDKGHVQGELALLGRVSRHLLVLENLLREALPSAGVSVHRLAKFDCVRLM